MVSDSVPPDRGPKAKLFISYSRKDMVFADRLEEGLKARGFAVLIDRTEIYAFEDWWKRIEALIVQADTIVFALSPDAIASDVCGREVAFAASLNKRFAPIVCRPVDVESVPAALRRLNFISFEDTTRFDEWIDRLAEALSTDIDWVRKHTQFGEQARRWSEAGRPGPQGLLLRSPVLEEAERWIASRPRDVPLPTEATQAYIAESRRAATKRRQVLTASLAVGLLVTLGLAGIAYWQREIAVEQTAIASKQRDTVLLQQSQFLGGLSRQQTESGHDAAAGLSLALEALPDADGADALAKSRPFWAPAEVSLEAARRALREKIVLKGHTSQVNSIAVTADGAKVVTGSSDGTTRMWDAETGAELLTLKGDDDGLPVRSIAVTPDGARVAAGSSSYGASARGSVRLWDARTGTELFVKEQDGVVASVAVTADGERVVAAVGHAVYFWDAKTGAELKRFDVASNAVMSVAITPDGRVIVAGLSGASALVWDGNTGAELATLKGGHRGVVTSVAITADGRRVVTGARGIGSDDNTARLWDAETGAELLVLKGHSDAVTGVAVTADGERIATVSMDRSARLWDVRSGFQLLSLGGHTDPIWGVAITSDAARIATAAGMEIPSHGSQDNTARLWNARIGHGVALQVHRVARVAVTPDGARIVTDGETGTVLDARTGKQLFTLDGHSRSVGAVAVSPDGAHFVTGSEDRTARVWDARDGAILSRLEGHTDSVTGVAVTPDGSRIVTGSADKTARVWDAKTGVELRVLTGHAAGVTGVAAMPDRSRIVTGSADKTARVWDAKTGAELRVLKGHTDEVTSVAAMPDGIRIVTGSDDGTARVWNAETGSELLALRGHDGGIWSVAVTPDGARIITAGSTDKTVRLWDATTGALQAVVKAGADQLAGIAAMPNGREIVVAMDDRRDILQRTYFNSTQVWPLFPAGQALIDEAKLLVPRCLSLPQRQTFNLPLAPPGWCVSKQKWPYDAETWVRNIRNLVADKKDQDALAQAAIAVALDASLASKIDFAWTEQLSNRGLSLLLDNSIDEALSAFDDAIQRARRNADLRSVLGDALLGRGYGFVAKRQFAEALRDFREALVLGNETAKTAIWSTTIQASRVLIDQNPERALLDAVTTSLDATPETIGEIGNDTSQWSSIVTLSVGLIHARLMTSQDQISVVDRCDQLAANPYDPLRKGTGVASQDMDAQQAFAACDLAARNNPGEPRYLYQRARAREGVARAAATRTDLDAVKANYSASVADFEAAMAGDYPMAFHGMAMASGLKYGGNASPEKATTYFLQALNRVLRCCWAPVARHLLAQEVKLDKSPVRRVAREMTLWAASLGSEPSRDLLTELAKKGVVAPVQSIPNAAVTDTPPWLRGNVPTEVR